MAIERVLIHSNGLRLVGDLYLPLGQGPWPAVVICHGLGSHKERHAEFAGHAASRGLAALTFDMRGHGESEGKLDGQTLADVEAALAFLKQRPEINPKAIAVRGSSLGGHYAIHAAARSLEFKAVVAICPAPEPMLLEGLRRAIDEGLDMPEVRVDLVSLPRYLRESDLRRSVTQITPRPLLIIHCTGDEVVPFDRSVELHKVAGEPKDLWLIPGGSHTTAQHDASTHARTVAWLLARLTP
ncbi:MAG: alpha/beta hydrolase [Chloroflexota bacterium]